MSSYEQSNVGMGMVPHKKNCRCDECTIERLEARVAELESAMREIEPYIDVIICYASTCSEHEGNRVARAFTKALKGEGDD